MKYEALIVEKTGDLMTVTFNRPQILNALNKQMMLEMRDLLGELRHDQQTRFVIFTGAGKAFTAGVEFSRQAMQERYADPELSSERLWQLFGHDFMRGMESLEQITFAAVNGPAIGGGQGVACIIKKA